MDPIKNNHHIDQTGSKKLRLHLQAMVKLRISLEIKGVGCNTWLHHGKFPIRLGPWDIKMDAVIRRDARPTKSSEWNQSPHHLRPYYIRYQVLDLWLKYVTVT